MSLGQILPGHMSPSHIASGKYGPTNLHLKFNPNGFSNSRDIADIDKCCLDKCCLD